MSAECGLSSEVLSFHVFARRGVGKSSFLRAFLDFEQPPLGMKLRSGLHTPADVQTSRGDANK